MGSGFDAHFISTAILCLSIPGRDFHRLDLEIIPGNQLINLPR